MELQVAGYRLRVAEQQFIELLGLLEFIELVSGAVLL